MYKKILISEIEKKRILNLYLKEEQEGGVESEFKNPRVVLQKYSKNIKAWQQLLVCLGENLGDYGPLKNGVDGVWGRLSQKSLDKVLGKTKAVKNDENFMELLLKGGDYFKNIKCLLTIEKKVDYKKNTSQTKTPKKDKDVPPTDYDCIAVSAEMCRKISDTQTVDIGSDEKLSGCAAYAQKCLSEYGSKYLGNAWSAFNIRKNSGQVEYNLYSNLQWDRLEKEIQKLGYNDKKCEKFKTEEITNNKNVDQMIDGGKLAGKIQSIMPSQSDIKMNQLQLGDIVGIYLDSSSNKGRAFCDSADLTPDGKIKNKNATINTHIGFVGSVKNGMPIIFHGIHGHFKATPANLLLNKRGQGMIAWVITDPTIEKNVGKKFGYVQPSWYEKNVEPYYNKLKQYIE